MPIFNGNGNIADISVLPVFNEQVKFVEFLFIIFSFVKYNREPSIDEIDEVLIKVLGSNNSTEFDKYGYDDYGGSLKKRTEIGYDRQSLNGVSHKNYNEEVIFSNILMHDKDNHLSDGLSELDVFVFNVKIILDTDNEPKFSQGFNAHLEFTKFYFNSWLLRESLFKELFEEFKNEEDRDVIKESEQLVWKNPDWSFSKSISKSDYEKRNQSEELLNKVIDTYTTRSDLSNDYSKHIFSLGDGSNTSGLFYQRNYGIKIFPYLKRDNLSIEFIEDGPNKRQVNVGNSEIFKSQHTVKIPIDHNKLFIGVWGINFVNEAIWFDVSFTTNSSDTQLDSIRLYYGLVDNNKIGVTLYNVKPDNDIIVVKSIDLVSYQISLSLKKYGSDGGVISTTEYVCSYIYPNTLLIDSRLKDVITNIEITVDAKKGTSVDETIYFINSSITNLDVPKTIYLPIKFSPDSFSLPNDQNTIDTINELVELFTSILKRFGNYRIELEIKGLNVGKAYALGSGIDYFESDPDQSEGSSFPSNQQRRYSIFGFDLDNINQVVTIKINSFVDRRPSFLGQNHYSGDTNSLQLLNSYTCGTDCSIPTNRTRYNLILSGLRSFSLIEKVLSSLENQVDIYFSNFERENLQNLSIEDTQCELIVQYPGELAEFTKNLSFNDYLTLKINYQP